MAERPPRFFVDFDGTVVDNRRRMYQFCCDWYPGGRFSSMLDIDDYWALKRMGVNELEWIDRRFGATIGAREWSEMKLAHMEDEGYLCMDRLIDGAAEALSSLSGLGEVVLVSRREREGALMRQVRKLGVDDCLSGMIVVSHSDVTKAQAIRQRYRVCPDDAVVGDTEDDVSAALSLGTRGCLVLSGARGRWVLEALGCGVSRIAVAGNLADMVERFDDSGNGPVPEDDDNGLKG